MRTIFSEGSTNARRWCRAYSAVMAPSRTPGRTPGEVPTTGATFTPKSFRFFPGVHHVYLNDPPCVPPCVLTRGRNKLSYLLHFSVCLCVAAACIMRGAACAAARRAASVCCARAYLCRAACAHTRGRRTRHRDLPPTSPPACVRACGLACAKSPPHARCTPPRSCSSASCDRADRAAAHLGGAGRREGRSTVTSSTISTISI